MADGPAENAGWAAGINCDARLVDAPIVHRLYGLTEEEVALVEGGPAAKAKP